eukprot:8115828-Alexandrium_andersonii.AAC.1
MLADDLLVHTSSGGAEEDEVIEAHLQAVQCTVNYAGDLGSRLSPEKCVLMASTARARRVLKRHVFERINVGFSLRQHARDLGAHLSTCARAIGKTLKQKIRNG